MRLLILFVTLIFFISSCFTGNSKDKTFTIYSESVRDSFEIFVDLPVSFKDGDDCDVFYYLDANLKSGKKIRQFIQDSVTNRASCRTIFVGIGHIGNYRVLRRRDFTVPRIENNDTTGYSENFGQIDNFYMFLKTELIPNIQSRYHPGGRNHSVFGHSFGGLFSVYCLFRNDTLFNNFYSLSPSLWINDYAIYSFNRLRDSLQAKKHLFLSVGGGETLNRIKSGADDLDEYLKAKKYPYLTYEYRIYPGESHNSQVPLSIEDIFGAKK